MPKLRDYRPKPPASSFTRRSSRQLRSKSKIQPSQLPSPPPKVLLNQFPSEILLEIFDYLKTPDLISLTLTCHTFNSVINNTKLSDKFTLNFNENFQSRVWIGSRRYSKLKMEDEKGSFVILNSIGKDIKSITIDVRSIDLKTIARILNLCPALTFIKFEDVKTHSFLDSVGNKELPNHENLEVWIENTTPNIFELFKFMKIRKLTIVGPTRESDFDSCYSTGDCRIAFGRFMSSQTILEDLTLIDFKPPATLFGDNKTDTVPFRLKKLKVKNFRLDNVNFFRFLNNHKDTIETVDMDQRGLTHEFVTFLENSPKFHELVYVGTLIAARPFKNVTKLNVHLYVARLNWHQFFPNVKELKIRSDCAIGTIFANFDAMKKLERLEIHSSHFPNMRSVCIPTVKYLTFRHVTCDFPKLFEFRTSNLDELKIDNCNVVWLPFYLEGKNVKLKKLTVANTNLNESYQKVIKTLKGVKVEHVKFINVTQNDEGEHFSDYINTWKEKHGKN